jgi:hypothetical protein
MQLKISEILNDLTNGQTRQQIKEKYNLSTAQLKSVFSHPQLKGRKTKKVEQPIDLLDDVTPVNNPTPTNQVVVNTSTEEVETYTPFVEE